MVAAFGATVAIFGVVVFVGGFRQLVLGRPPAKISPAGITVAGVSIDWSEVVDIEAASTLGIRYLAVIVEEQTTMRFSRISRLGLIVRHGRFRLLELAEAQLGIDVNTALARAEVDRSSASSVR